MTPPPRRPDDDLPPLPPLPVGEPVEPDPFAETVYAEVVEPDRPDDLADLPVAVPVRPADGPARSKESGRRDSLSFPRSAAATPDPEPVDPHRRRVLAACSVLGCLGVGVLVAVGFLAYGAIVILNHFGERIADPDRPAAVAGDGSRPGPIRPTALAARTAAVKLDDEFDAVGRAAGGRYLLFRVPSRKRIVAFDANTGGMAPGFEVRLDEPNSLFAGGAAKLWVYQPKAHEVVRVDLLTGRIEQRAAAPADARGAVDAVAVGAGSDGPVYLVAGTRRQTDIWLIDGAGLTQTGFVRFPDGVGDAVRVRASDDGRLLAVSGRSGAAVIHPAPAAGGSRFEPLRAGDAPVTVATPAPDGRFVYTPPGVFTAGQEPLFPGGFADGRSFGLPAAHGGEFCLSLDVRPAGTLAGPPELRRAGSWAVAGTLSGVSFPRGMAAIDDGDVTPDQRLWYWPAAGLAAVLPTDNTTIKLWKVDIPVVRPNPGD